jgi:phenylacetic acid degradation operon negative regulatory protein
MADRLASATRSLVSRFRRQRPIRAGSLLITIFGDAVAPHGGAITLGSLIRLAQPFGITERLVRTSVARLAHDGWLVSQRDGRRSEYRLATAGRRRFAEATQRIYGSASDASPVWDGRWTLLLLPADSAARERIREEFEWMGFGQLNAGLMAHPTHDTAAARARLRAIRGMNGGLVDLAIFEAASGDVDADRQLVASGWDLDTLARRYRQFVTNFSPVLAAVDAGRTLDPELAFLVRTLLIHEYRKIHLRDPLLPRELLPDDWAGHSANDLCRDLYARIFAAAQIHFLSIAERTRGTLPALKRGTYTRFGGLPR